MSTVSLRKTVIAFFISLVIILCAEKISAQNCDPNTPFYSCNLSGNPNGTWLSPSGHRVGLCCSAVSPDVCVEILVTLDSFATGMNFNIATGAVPPGALYYQIDCGVPTPVGQPICLDGPGPYHLTFCKPGNNPNSYSITSFGPPTISAQVNNIASPNCSATLSLVGTLYSIPSLTWSSVPPNALYNSFLSCTTGCETVTVMPTGNLPPYVDYRVCGAGSDPCNIAYVCDTVRVYFFNALNVSVTPGMTLCGGVTSTPISATVTGGSGAYQYSWSNGQTTSGITAGAGTYTVTVSDTAICATKSATTTITVVPPIISMAGIDVTICANQPSVSLLGNIQTATSAVWTGGSGTYSPNSSSLNVTYTPTAFEIANGYVQFILQTTLNMGCPGASDTVLVTIADVPVASISGNTSACANGPNFFTAPFEAGTTYAWSVAGGIINGPSNTNTLSVNWGPSSNGTVSLTMTSILGCSSSASTAVNISQPVNAAAGSDMIICQNQNSIALNGTYQNSSSFMWIGNGIFNPSNTVLNPTYTPSAGEIANGYAQLILQAGSNQGCPGVNDTIILTLGEIPAPVISGSTNVCSNLPVVYSTANVAGVTYSWTVTGGIINGPANSNSINVTWGAGNSGSISLLMTNAAGCSASANAAINISQPISSIAGNDIAICETQTTVQLNGNVQNAPGFWWIGGSGTFSPGNSVLNPVYTPSAAEIANGSAQLILQAAANQGCPSARDTILITISQIPNAAISGSTNICANAPIIYSAPLEASTTYTWTVAGGIINGPTNANSINVSWGSGANGTINLTMTNTAGCSASANVAVNISQPILSLAGNDISICETQTTVQLNGNVQNAPGFLWIGGNGTFSPGNSVLNPVYTPSATEIANGSAQLILQAAANQGCPSARDTILITISQIPSAAISGSTNICANAPINYSAPLEASTTYTWTVAGGIINGPTNSNSINVSWGSGSNGTISLTMTNTAGCSASANVAVNISQPISSIAGNDISICETQSTVQLNGNVQNAPGFMWIGGNGTFSPGNSVMNPVYTPSSTEIANGSAQLILQAAANQGCPSSNDTILIAISQIPNAAISGSINICANAPILYSSPNEAGTTYTWTVAGGTINGPTNSNSINISWGSGSNGTIDLTMTNAAGCSASANVAVNISQPIVSLAGSDVSICESITQVSLQGQVQNTTEFLWAGGNGTFTPGNSVLNPSYSPSASEIANGFAKLVLQTFPSQACAGATDTILITIFQDPDPSVTGNAVACSNSTGNFSSILEPGNTYNWSVTGGSINGSSNSNSINTVWGNSGPCAITLTVTNADGCIATSTQNISLIVLPNPVINGNGNPCQLSSANYSVNSSPGSTYSWSVLNGNIIGGNSGNAVNISWLNPGSGVVTVTETNSYGCSLSNTFPANISELSIPFITGSSSVCTGTSSTTYVTPNIPNTTYSWTVNGGTILSGNGSNSISVLWNSAGANSIMLTATNLTGCDSTIIYTVNVTTVNPPSTMSTGLKGCPPLTVTFSGNQPAPGQTYQWTFGDEQNSIAVNPSHTYITPGTYQVAVSTQNGPGCEASSMAIVQVFEEPTASFSHNFEEEVYYIGESSLEITNTTFHGTAHYWTFGDSEPVQAFEPENVYEEQGDFLITLISLSADGCPDTATKMIHVRNHEHMYLPNAFTPNGDGTNEYFSMLHSNIKEITINIFNRWGHNFFTSHDPDFKWDGTYAGNFVENGVYIYRIEAVGESGKAYVQIGTVTLIR